jgi:hypothetical protein
MFVYESLLTQCSVSISPRRANQKPGMLFRVKTLLATQPIV